MTGFYLNVIDKTKINLFLNTFVSSVIVSIAVFFILKLSDVTVSFRYFYFSLLVLLFLMFVITYVLRRLQFNQIQHNLKTKKWTINTLIVGDGKNAQKIADDLEKLVYQQSFAGYVSVFRNSKNPDKLKILGNLYEIKSIIENYKIERVIVALDDDEAVDNQLLKIINQLYQHNVEISFTPGLYEILTGSARIGKLGINPLVSITGLNMPDWQISVK